MYRSTSFSQLPEVVKNLLIINGLLFLGKVSLESKGIDLTQMLALHQFQSPNFRPYQLITHFFMHANFTHLLFNMFALWMFGKILENFWGGKRFLIYYMFTGIGAALLHLAFSQYQIYQLTNNIPEILDLARQGLYNTDNPNSLKLTQLVITPTVGASGAVFGILLAFGMLFPNTKLHLLAIFLVFIILEFILNIKINYLICFIILTILSQIDSKIRYYVFYTIAIKAIYFVIAYGLLELYLGLSNNPADNIAHFAHLGGMLFGFILLRYWQKKRNTFY